MYILIFFCLLNISFGSTSCSSDCSGHGKCLTDECVCQPHYHWSECQIHKCFGIRNDNPFVCNGNGACVDVDTCECDANYEGVECELTTCYGIPSEGDLDVCSGNGKCIQFDTCECYPGWGLEKCDQIMCFDRFPTDPQVCTGRGECIDANVCKCEGDWKGKNCELKECFGKLENNPNVCGGGGLCVDFNKCECIEGYAGNECDRKRCFGIWSDEPTVCSGGNGECLAYNQCDCLPGYLGVNCQYRSCHGKHAIFFDTFEALGGDLDSVNDAIWTQSLTFARPSSGGCGAVSESGRSLFFSGPVEERVAVTQTVAVVDGADQKHSMSFHIMMATGEEGCEGVYFTDDVVVQVEYPETGKKFLLEKLEPSRFAMRSRKVVFEFYPQRDFRIIIEQPRLYDDKMAQFSIDSFLIAVDDYLEPPCNSNGVCNQETGQCECFPMRGEGEECKEDGCPIPKFTDIAPTEGAYEGGTEVVLSGCFEEDVTKCRFYAPWRQADDKSVEVPARVFANGTKLACTTPPLERIMADRIAIDVYSGELDDWHHYDMVHFYYFAKNTRKRTWDKSMAQIGQLETSGIFWDKVDVESTEHDSLDLHMTLYFLKKPSEWKYVNENAQSSFYVRPVVEHAVISSLLKFNTRMYELSSKINPDHLQLYGIDITCYFHASTELVPCNSFVKRKKLNVDDETSRVYCDGWYEANPEDPKWNRKLIACPLTIAEAKKNGLFTVDPTCSEDFGSLKTCRYFYPFAKECYVSNDAEKHTRRCCYNEDDELILHGCSSGRSSLCGRGETCWLDDSTRYNHFEDDELPLDVCQVNREECEEVEKRRPPRGDDDVTWISPPCRCWGDPSCTSWDQTTYSYMGECSYWLLRQSIGQQHLHVQAHFHGQPASRTSAIAFRHFSLETPLFQVYAQGGRAIMKMDSEPLNWKKDWDQPKIKLWYSETQVCGACPDRRQVQTGRRQGCNCQPRTYMTFTFETGEIIELDIWGRRINFYIRDLFSHMYWDNTEGLCGKWNEDKIEDLMFRYDSSRYHTTGGAANEFGLSWLVMKNESMFLLNGEPNTCGPEQPTFLYPPAPDPYDFPDWIPSERDEAVAKCSEFVSDDHYFQCLYDSYYEETDEVLEYAIRDDVISQEMYKESVVLPVISFQDLEQPVPVRRNALSLIPFKLVRSTHDISEEVELKVTKIRLEENFEHVMFNEVLLSQFTVEFVERKALRIEFSDVDLVGKIFEIELQVGDEVYGFEYTTFFIETLCESGLSGDECDEIACFDIAKSSEIACNGNGLCVDKDTCLCDEGYVGSECEWGYVSDDIQKVQIVLPDPIVHNWEKLVLSTKVELPLGKEDVEVYYEWVVEGEQDSHPDVFLTPRFQDEIATRPYAFEPYTEHTFKVVARSELGDVVCRKKVFIMASLSEVFVDVRPDKEERNKFEIDVSYYRFKEKIITYSYVNPRSGRDTILHRSSDPIVTVHIPSSITGVLTFRVRVFHIPTKKEVVIEKVVNVWKTEFTTAKVAQYCEEKKLFESDEEILDNPYYLQDIAYLVAWLNEFELVTEIEVMATYRTKIFNALMVYSASIDLDRVDEYLLILHGVTVNLNLFPPSSPKDTSFEVSFAMVFDSFIYNIKEALNSRLDLVEPIVHDAYSNLLFQMLKLRAKFVNEKDVLVVMDSYESLLDTLSEYNKVNGEQLFHKMSREHFVPFSIKQHRLRLESSPLKVAETVEISFPIYAEDSPTEDIQVKALVFNKNPLTTSERRDTDCKTVRIRMLGKQKDEFYTVTLKGQFDKRSLFKYYDVVQEKWIEIDMKLYKPKSTKDDSEAPPPRVYVSSISATTMEFGTNLDNVVFAVFDTTPWDLILGFSIGVPTALGILFCICCVVAIIVGIIVIVKVMRKKEEYSLLREDMLQDVEKMEQYEKFVDEENIDTEKVGKHAQKFDDMAKEKREKYAKRDRDLGKSV